MVEHQFEALGVVGSIPSSSTISCYAQVLTFTIDLIHIWWAMGAFRSIYLLYSAIRKKRVGIRFRFIMKLKRLYAPLSDPPMPGIDSS